MRAALTRDGRSLTQAAFGWLWARNPGTVPISGFTTEAQVEANVGALTFGALSAAQMDEVGAQMRLAV